MSFPLHRLPSLDLLRGFVAVARRMSITQAARDLFLTQSAVSRQIRSLEEALGVPLFVRRHRAIALTPEGERLFRVADYAVQQLQDRVALLLDAAQDRPVGITCSVGVAGLWLLPRLHQFFHAHPDIEVRLSASDTVSDLKQDGFDLAIRYCPNENAPADAVWLFDEVVQPVAHASIDLNRCLSPRGIRDAVLLEFEGSYRPWLRWKEWMAHQGWRDARPKRVIRFNHYDQLIHAAVAGQGIALGRLRLIDLYLADGRLQTTSDAKAAVPNGVGYWLVRPDHPMSSNVQKVVEWICREAKSSVYLPAPRRSRHD